MDFRLRYKEETIALSMAPVDDGGFVATLGEQRLGVAFERISEHQMRLTVDGGQILAFVAETPEGKAVMVAGRTWLLAEDRPTGTPSRAGAGNGPKTVTPPMPAVVTQILVSQGQTVERGEALLVVSAMKMDTILTAPFAGLVTRINVTEGQKVAPRQVLVDIEPAASDAADPAAGLAT